MATKYPYYTITHDKRLWLWSYSVFKYGYSGDQWGTLINITMTKWGARRLIAKEQRWQEAELHRDEVVYDSRKEEL